MNVSILIGDDVETIEGAKAKSQTLTATGTFDLYSIFGDAIYLLYGAKGGNDKIFGKSGGPDEIASVSNRLCGDGIQLTISAGGNDKIVGGNYVALNYLYGDALELSGSKGGNDQIAGGANAVKNTLFGDAFVMRDFTDEDGQTYVSRGGNDVLTGGAMAFNYLYGDSEYMLGGVGGNDVLVGGAFGSQNRLIGDAPEARGDVVGGNDRLVSGEGNDTMWGDFRYLFIANATLGHDTFVFTANNGIDEIRDFKNGDDKIEISGMAGIDDFSDLSIAVIGSDTYISFADGGSVKLIGVAEVQAQDFIFS